MGVQGAEVVVCPGLGESEREDVIGVEHWRFQGLARVYPDDRVRDVIVVGPGDGRADRSSQHDGREGEIVYRDCGCDCGPGRATAREARSSQNGGCAQNASCDYHRFTAPA